MKQNKDLVYLVTGIILLFILTGFIFFGIRESLYGFVRLQVHPARLINDFFAIEGIGATLINSAAVGLIALGIILGNKIHFSGPTFAGVLTIMGFGLFGKTPLNIIPIIFGVFISAKFTKKSFKEYLIIALFGTALGPITTFIAFEIGFPPFLSILIATGIGIIVGFLLPSLAVSMLHLHQGYNLYNMGLTCGFLGLFLASLIKSSGNDLGGSLIWYTDKNITAMLIIPLLSICFILSAIIATGKKSIKSFIKIQGIPGRLPSDFMDMADVPGALFNSGMLGLIGSFYVWIVGGDFNGPVIGGLLTIMGFGAFGTHLKNSWPVVFGVIISSIVFKYPLNSPGPILAAIFVTTLSPIPGQFGIVAGIIAGFIHLFVVMQSGSWHGGINLYNNGFAGGLTATIIIAFIQWYKTNKEKPIGGFRSKK